jgi:hypothetical protein
MTTIWLVLISIQSADEGHVNEYTNGGDKRSPFSKVSGSLAICEQRQVVGAKITNEKVP